MARRARSSSSTDAQALDFLRQQRRVLQLLHEGFAQLRRGRSSKSSGGREVRHQRGVRELVILALWRRSRAVVASASGWSGNSAAISSGDLEVLLERVTHTVRVVQVAPRVRGISGGRAPRASSARMKCTSLEHDVLHAELGGQLAAAPCSPAAGSRRHPHPSAGRPRDAAAIRGNSRRRRPP